MAGFSVRTGDEDPEAEADEGAGGMTGAGGTLFFAAGFSCGVCCAASEGLPGVAGFAGLAPAVREEDAPADAGLAVLGSSPDGFDGQCTP